MSGRFLLGFQRSHRRVCHEIRLPGCRRSHPPPATARSRNACSGQPARARVATPVLAPGSGTRSDPGHAPLGSCRSASQSTARSRATSAAASNSGSRTIGLSARSAQEVGSVAETPASAAAHPPSAFCSSMRRRASPCANSFSLTQIPRDPTNVRVSWPETDRSVP
jgi:hypothetical protein